MKKDQIERLEDQKDTLTRKLGKAVNRAEGFKLDLINKNKECSKLYEKVEAFAATEYAETNDLTSLQQLIRRSCGVDGVNNTQDENKYLRALVRGVREYHFNRSLIESTCIARQSHTQQQNTTNPRYDSNINP